MNATDQKLKTTQRTRSKRSKNISFPTPAMFLLTGSLCSSTCLDDLRCDITLNNNLKNQSYLICTVWCDVTDLALQTKRNSSSSLCLQHKAAGQEGLHLPTEVHLEGQCFISDCTANLRPISSLMSKKVLLGSKLIVLAALPIRHSA